MYTVYIIQSETTKRYYIGYTSDIEDRLRHHNSGANCSTRGKGPWRIVYTETFDDKVSAWKREQQIKSYRGGEAFKRLVE